ncbi:PrsW family glutamic-type intramembrane protease [Micromonospora sp. NPDC003197]
MTRPWSPLRTPTFWLLLATLALGTLGTLLLMFFMALVTPLAALVSLPPLLMFGLLSLLLIRQLDHLGRRPWWLVFMAYAWGATASIVAASGFNWFADVILAKVFSPWFAADWGAAIVAPIGEEIIKGIGVALLILAARPHLRTVFSGAVYGAIVGVGFTIVEDATYAWTSADEMLPDNIGEAFRILVLRIMVPGVAGHPLFSALVGAGIAYFALRTDQSRGRRFGMLGLGFGLGALCHFAVNAPLGFAATNALDKLPGFAPLGGLLLVIAAPALLGWIWLARIRRTETAQLTAELADPTRFADSALSIVPAGPAESAAAEVGTGGADAAGFGTAEPGTAEPGAGEPATAAVATAEEAYTLGSSLRRFRVVRAVRRAHGAAAAAAVRRLHRAQLRFVQLPVDPVPAAPAVYFPAIPAQPIPAPIASAQPTPIAVPAPAAPVQDAPAAPIQSAPTAPVQGTPAAPGQVAAPVPWPYPPMAGHYPPPLPGQWTPYGPAPVVPGQWQPIPGGQYPQSVPGQYSQPVPGGQWPPVPAQYPPPAPGGWYPTPPAPPGYPMPAPPGYPMPAQPGYPMPAQPGYGMPAHAWYPMPSPPVWQPSAPRPTPVQTARVELAAARAELARLTGSEHPPASPGTPEPAPAWLLATGFGLAVLGVVHWAAVLLGVLVMGVPVVLAWRRQQPLPPRLSWAVAAVVFSGYLWLTSWVLLLLFPGEV